MSRHKVAAHRNARPARAAGSRVLRIIGGAWRGRKLRFPDVAEIRPTPDRVRETLFNWLGARVAGARCLDLFAGSGALGLEALSRGAAHVTFVEQDAVAVRELRARLTEWGAQDAAVECSDARRFLARRAQPYDVVFLDPPFTAGLLPVVAQLLERDGWLARGALIYLESAARAPLPALPQAWMPLKGKRAGEVGYHLYARGTGL
ncbi:MAG TPA: 16S rRNA (guanine(966)-N(2))-methyltransferase RsmD [Steroidobacteraceae bacterium]|nr:16S rRNA (guanine(966)-N(2))-methyltransferase RsmD [Steroidobacteraceae bacterium]